MVYICSCHELLHDYLHNYSFGHFSSGAWGQSIPEWAPGQSKSCTGGKQRKFSAKHFYHGLLLRTSAEVWVEPTWARKTDHLLSLEPFE